MSMEERVRAALQGWFTKMAMQYCDKDYGSERINQYMFYRTVYEMTASQAWGEVKRCEGRGWLTGSPNM